MNSLSFFKQVSELAVATGVGAIISNASKQAVAPGAGLIKKGTIAFGTFILSSMVAEQAVKYTNEKIETGISEYQKTREMIAEAVEQQKAQQQAKADDKSED